MPKPVVAIVGRPNVGKSTLFNRMAGERLAIVEDVPGTTRDRLYTETEWNGRVFTIVDTGGLLGPNPLEAEPMTEAVRDQAQAAIDEADVVVFMVDARDGVTPADEEVADILRRSKKPVILVANKAESVARQQAAVEFYTLGLGDPIPVSALHGVNTGDFLDLIVEQLPPEQEEPEEDRDMIKVAIVGRPNVGKSSLFNKLIGQERAIVSEVPGTTRDAIDTVLMWEDQKLLLIDTGGLKRRGKIAPGIEKFSAIRAARAMERADVVLLLIDASEGITAQDTHIAGYVFDEAKGVVVVVNKWDLVPKGPRTMNEYTRKIQEDLKFIHYAPLLFISAQTGQRVQNIADTVIKVAHERHKRISTGELNRLLRDAVAEHAPPTKPGKWVKFLYATQVDVNPPTFVFFVNDAELVHFSYRRYLENRLREQFGFVGTPLVLVFRGREERE